MTLNRRRRSYKNFWNIQTLDYSIITLIVVLVTGLVGFKITLFSAICLVIWDLLIIKFTKKSK